MATSPALVPASQKRPLEEPGSPSAGDDQPDAKRQALDKITKLDNGTDSNTPEKAESPATNGKTEVKEGDAMVTDATPVPSATQKIQTTVSNTERGSSLHGAQDESSWIHVRAVITTTEAATVIGKGGENVTQIRRLSGAKCTISDYSRGAVERILTVSGPTDAVAKAFGLIVRTINFEPLEGHSTPESKAFPLRVLIPHVLVGPIIGKSGARIREIQEASGARLNVSESCLPLSTERSLVVLGVADSVHIATYYVATTLFEQLTERYGGPSASAYATRAGGPAGAIPGGLQVVPYIPQPVGGIYGHPGMQRNMPVRPPGQFGGYNPSMPHGPQGYGADISQPGYVAGQATTMRGTPIPAAQTAPSVPGQPLTQQIYIPNDMVGAIIGKGGVKINEIRQLSGSVIKINEPQDNSNERLVTITGTAECNQMALYMLYSRLENEKHRM